jgi:hypothetical protein
MKDTTLVLQGPIHPYTTKIIKEYAKLNFVDKIILSSWTDQTLHNPELLSDVEHGKILLGYSDYPENGPGNMNLQIYSSKRGIARSESRYTVKMRTDQLVSDDSMYKLNDFFRNQKQTLKFEDGTGPTGPVCVIGMSSVFPFHPQDHIFWGHTEDIAKIFECPLMTPEVRRKQQEGCNFNKELRCVIWLGAHYYAKFDSRVNKFIAEPFKYLVDAAPQRAEAMEVYNSIRDDVFKVTPKIDLWWYKYNSKYWYSCYESQGEYYAS